MTKALSVVAVLAVITACGGSNAKSIGDLRSRCDISAGEVKQDSQLGVTASYFECTDSKTGRSSIAVFDSAGDKDKAKQAGLQVSQQTGIPLVFIAEGSNWFQAKSGDDVTDPMEEQTRAPDPVFYENCSDAQYAGAAPISSDQPGYRSELDADGDGVACSSELDLQSSG